MAGILHLLASILTMISLYTINLRVMGNPIRRCWARQQCSPVRRAGAAILLADAGLPAAAAVLAVWLVTRFLTSEIGLGMRATGANPRMAASQGSRPAA